VGLLEELDKVLLERRQNVAVVTLSLLCILSVFTATSGAHPYSSNLSLPNLVNQQPSSGSPIAEFPIPYPSPGPNAIVAAPNNVYWFVEYNTGNIGEYNSTSKSFNQFAIPEIRGVAVPASLALDSLGRIWFTDQNTNNPSVGVLNASTPGGAFTQYPIHTQNSTPVFVTVDSSNQVWFTDTTGNYLDNLDPSTGAISGYPLPTANSGPAEIAFQNGTSYIWITESFANKIARFDSSPPSNTSNTGGHFREYAPTVSLQSPVGIVVDKDGNVWVSEHGASSIAELIPSNSSFRKYPTSQPSAFKTTAPATLSLDRLGRLWFVEHFGNKVGRLDPRTGVMDEFNIPTTGLAYSLRNALDANNNFWFTEYTANRIGMIEWNATAPVAISSTLAPVAVNAGQTISSQMSLSDAVSSPVVVKLNVTSTFTTYGQTSSTEVALSNYSLTIAPNQPKTITATITPDSNLSSGLYAAGVEATYGNTSIIGVVFLQVHGSASILGLLITYLPAIAIAAAAALLVTTILIKRRRVSASGTSAVKPPIATIVVIALTMLALTVGVIPESAAKCIGLPPPPTNGQPAGPDYVGLGLDIGSLAFFVLVLILILRNRSKNKPSPNNPR
jgi:virginiamycin B lyase